MRRLVALASCMRKQSFESKLTMLLGALMNKLDPRLRGTASKYMLSWLGAPLATTVMVAKDSGLISRSYLAIAFQCILAEVAGQRCFGGSENSEASSSAHCMVKDSTGAGPRMAGI